MASSKHADQELFDDIDLARFADPALTTVHQPIARKGNHAVELLLAILEGRDEPDQHETSRRSREYRAGRRMPLR